MDNVFSDEEQDRRKAFKTYIEAHGIARYKAKNIKKEEFFQYPNPEEDDIKIYKRRSGKPINEQHSCIRASKRFQQFLSRCDPGFSSPIGERRLQELEWAAKFSRSFENFLFLPHSPETDAKFRTQPLMMIYESSQQRQFLVDTGAGAHVINRKDLTEEEHKSIQYIDEPFTVRKWTGAHVINRKL